MSFTGNSSVGFREPQCAVPRERLVRDPRRKPWGAGGAAGPEPLTCALVLRARCLRRGAARSPARPRVGARRSRTAHSQLRVQARRAGRHCIYWRRRCQEARRPGGGQGRADWRELAATGCSLRGGRRPSLGMQSEGPPALAAPAPVTVGTRDPRKTPRGVGAAIGGSPPGWPSGAAPAEIPQREGSAFPSGLGSRVRGGGVRKGSVFPYPRGRRVGSPPFRRCAAWGGPPSVLPFGKLCLWVTGASPR